MGWERCQEVGRIARSETGLNQGKVLPLVSLVRAIGEYQSSSKAASVLAQYNRLRQWAAE